MPARHITAPRLVELIGSAADASPAYRGLADGIRLLIADGRVPVGTRLPSERELTAALGVSRTTVTRAYAALRDGGCLTSRQGSGSVAVLPAGALRSSGLSPATPGSEGIDLTCAAMSAPPGMIDAVEAATAALPAHLGTLGYHPLGLPALREAVAAEYTRRGLPTDVEQVMVTSGALAGLAATTRALLAPGDRVLMESPTYPNAIAAVRQSGARAVALPLDRSGWDIAALEAALRQTAPRAAYLIPDFHNPTGALMSEEQRAAAGAALAATHTVAIVDETVVDLAFDADEPMPRPLAAFHARTVTLGGASKTYWGGLRIGWIRAPREVMSQIAEARLSLDLSAPVLEQLVLLELMARRDEVLAARRASIAASREALVGALQEYLPEWRFTLPRGGLCLWVELPAALSTALAIAAERQGVVLAAGPQFAVEGGLERHVRLPFTDHPPELLREAVRRLALAWAEAATVRTGRRMAAPLVA